MSQFLAAGIEGLLTLSVVILLLITSVLYFIMLIMSLILFVGLSKFLTLSCSIVSRRSSLIHQMLSLLEASLFRILRLER